MATEAFFDLLRELLETGLPIAITCRQEELEEIQKGVHAQLLERFRRIKIAVLSHNKGHEICTKLGLDWYGIRPHFKGTIGSITGVRQAIRSNVENLDWRTRTLLQVFHDLHSCGLDDGDGAFGLAHARRLWRSRTEGMPRFNHYVEVLRKQNILDRGRDFCLVSLEVLSVAFQDEQQEVTEILIRELNKVFADDGKVLQRIGQEARRLGIYDGAIECFEGWHQRSGNVFALLYLGATHGLKRNYDKAIAVTQQAADTWIWRWWVRKRVQTYAHNNLATYYAKRYEEDGCCDQSLFAAAIEAFKRAQEVGPDYAPCWYGLGAFYQRLGLLAEAEPYLRRGAELERFENPTTNRILEKVLEANGKMGDALTVLQKMETRTWEEVSRVKVLSRMSEVLINLHDEQPNAGFLQQAIEKATAAVDADRTSRFGWQNLMFSRLLACARLETETLRELSGIYQKGKEAVVDVGSFTEIVRRHLPTWVRRRMKVNAFGSQADFDEQLAIWNATMGRDLYQTAEDIKKAILHKHPGLESLPEYRVVFGSSNR